MEIDQQLLNELRIVFESELKEYAEVITDGLLSLEKTQYVSSSQDKLEEIFRAAHSIKGSARGIGLSHIVEIAHRLESIFSLFKKGEIVLSAAIVDKLLLAVDLMQDLAATDQKTTSTSVNFSGLINDLDDFIRNKITTGSVQKKNIPLESGHDSVISDGDKVDGHEEQARVPIEKRSAPRLETYSISDKYVNQLSAIAENVLTIKNEKQQQLLSMHRIIDQLEFCSNSWADTISHFSPSLTEEMKEKLQGHASELYAAINQARQVYNSNRQINRHLNHVSLALKNSTHSLQLVPLAALLAPLYRIVRELTNQLGKKVNFRIQGGDIEIDRKLYKFIHDPIVHLINNAIDHGIEPPDIRKRMGKPEEAHLWLDIRKQGEMLSIRVKDDGAGIDVESIKSKAIQKKWLTQPELETLNHRELVDLIFISGFSLKEIITEVSGRGVGLDVVRNNLRRVRGDIEIETEQGKGCSFNLLIPSSLTSERGILVKTAGKIFVLADFIVDKVMIVAKDAVEELAGKPVIFYKQEPVPLCGLAQVLGLTHLPDTRQERYSVVLISNERSKIALAVDEILGERELIIRPFNYPLIKVRNVASIAMLGNGEMGLVLNEVNLIDSALKTQYALNHQEDQAAKVERPRILVVEDTATTRTLEQRILETQGYRVHTVNDGARAWESVQNNPYDLVITDIEMPMMNGFDLVERIKKNPQTKNIPVVIVTSLNTKENKHRGIKVGADAYVTKDLFSTELFLKIIEQLL